MNRNYCRNCNSPLPTGRWAFCDDRCTKEYRRTRPEHLSPKTWGVVSELRVAVDLLSQGFDVYQAFSSGPCDLIAGLGPRLARVEVKTARRAVNGRPIFSLSLGQADKFDILALYFPDEDAIEYLPSLSSYF